MNNLFASNEISKQKRLSIKLFAVICLVVSSILFSSLSAFAITLSLTVNAQRSTSDLCGGNKVCCVTFTMDIPNGTTLNGFSFTLSGGTAPPAPDACWDLSCAGAHATPTGYTPREADHQTLSFDYTNGGHTTGLVGPATFSFILCPVDGANCDGNWPTLTWSDDHVTGGILTHDGPTAETIPGNNCNTNTDCKNCDQIDAYNGPLNCSEEICFTEHWPSTTGVTGFVLHVTPALPNYPCTPSGSCGSASPTLNTANPSGWTIATGGTVNTSPNGGGTDIIVSSNTNLTGCQTVCVEIPKCSSASHTITLSGVTGSSSSCNPHANTLTGISFKLGGSIETSDLDNTSQNYPNPLTTHSQFKTVIPFSIANEGEARIAILDVTGKVVFKEIQSFSGSGKHFFYFTGERLPAGKYFYTIESPLGNKIVEKTMLIVK